MELLEVLREKKNTFGYIYLLDMYDYDGEIHPKVFPRVIDIAVFNLIIYFELLYLINLFIMILYLMNGG